MNIFCRFGFHLRRVIGWRSGWNKDKTNGQWKWIKRCRFCDNEIEVDWE